MKRSNHLLKRKKKLVLLRETVDSARVLGDSGVTVAEMMSIQIALKVGLRSKAKARIKKSILRRKIIC